MKEKILKSIDDFAVTCYTMFKIGAGDFAKKNFPVLVNDIWDESESDEQNLIIIKSMFNVNKNLYEVQGNMSAAQTIDVFVKGWLDKITM
ncbi:hypothetical protein J6O48_07230 [bacterium]|nr:hypothetical protein [bacterium]